MPRVYRIEHKEDGYGPYYWNDRNEYWWSEDEHDSLERTPHPDDDGLYYINTVHPSYEYVYGFKSVKQLCEWFTKFERYCLFSSGYQVKCYNVDDSLIHYGDHQLKFHRRSNED